MLQFTTADPEFYESLSRYNAGPEFLDCLAPLLPTGWTTARTDAWIAVRPPTVEMPEQGFKIHVSSLPHHALRVLELVASECIARGIAFKCAADQYLLGILNSKNYSRTGAGKFITIYPPALDSFRGLIETLYRRTRHLELRGPFILSDRRYKDSAILYYRYGGFARMGRLRVDGTREHSIRSPEGTFVPDERALGSPLPPWVEDPLPQQPGDEPAGPPLLAGRFLIQGAIKFSNRGGGVSRSR